MMATTNSSFDSPEPRLPKRCVARSGCPMCSTDTQPPTAKHAKAINAPKNRTFLNLPVSSPTAKNTKLPDVTPSSTLKTRRGH